MKTFSCSFNEISAAHPHVSLWDSPKLFFSLDKRKTALYIIGQQQTVTCNDREKIFSVCYRELPYAARQCREKRDTGP